MKKIMALFSILVLILTGCGEKPADMPAVEAVRPLSEAEREKQFVGRTETEIHAAWGEPDGMLSGFWGDIYHLPDSWESIVFYYDAGGTVTEIRSLQRNEESEPQVPTEPPELTVSAGETDAEAWKGSYNWMYSTDGKDAWSGVLADSAHPLEETTRKWMPVIEADEARAVSLCFDLPPDDIAVRCWPVERWGSTDAVSESAAVKGGSVALKDGAWIYEVTAVWDSEYYEGHVSYSFVAE